MDPGPGAQHVQDIIFTKIVVHELYSTCNT